jgi:intein-encoded DNA endonuclease-like protein
MNDCDRAYFAGFFDGEGCVSIARQRGRSYSLIVQVSQKRLDQLERLQTEYGGRISIGDAGNWVVIGLSAYNFLADIYPWLQEKRDQVELAIEYSYLFGFGQIGRRRTADEKNTQQIMYELMRSLKR